MDCLFCKIIAGDIPSTKLYEDDQVFVFKDINPEAPTHFLVVPKVHIASPAEIGPEHEAIIGHVYTVIAQLARELKLENGFRVVCNCGAEGGQTVEHIHYHVLAGRNLSWPPG